MDKETFIMALIEMYPNSFTESNTQMWIEAYSAVLPDKLDFQELFDDLLVNYTSTNYAPSTGFFKPYIDKQLDRIRRDNEYYPLDKVMKKFYEEKEEIIKNDKPMTTPVLSPLELLTKENNSYDGRGYFTDSQMHLFKDYVKTITMENLRIKFWQDVAKLIMGGKNNELCRNVQKVCS